jgi:hypothetical protein
VEQRLGVALPGDYKTYIDRYGTGSFSDFIFPLNPFTSNEYLNLFYVLETHHQALRVTQQRMSAVHWTPIEPFALYPAENGLLPWGTATNFGETFFWHVNGVPEKWSTVFYNLREGEYEVFKTTFTGLLAGLISGEIESVLILETFSPSAVPIAFRSG